MSKEQNEEKSSSKKSNVIVLIPAFNEAEIVAQTINAIPLHFDIMVINNGSTDQTASIVHQTRAILVEEHRKGFGSIHHRHVRIGDSRFKNWTKC